MPAIAFAWAFDFTPSPALLSVIAIVGIALLGIAWFGIKFWLASTRPANIQEIQTPTLDRINRQALEALGDDEEDEDEEAPDGLKDVVDEPGDQGA